MKPLVALLLAPALTLAQEQKVPVSRIPPEIRAAVKARFPDSPIAGAVKETEDGKTFYEVTLKAGGKNVDVTVTQAGAVTFIEKELKRSELPASVSQLLETKYPKAKWQTVEDVSTVTAKGTTRTYYEILLVDATKQAWEVQVALDGFTILKEEKKKAGKTD